MNKKYKDVSDETLKKEFDNEDSSVVVSVKDRQLIEQDGFITVHPSIKKVSI